MLLIKEDLDDSGRWREWHVNEHPPKIEGHVIMDTSLISF